MLLGRAEWNQNPRAARELSFDFRQPAFGQQVLAVRGHVCFLFWR